MIRSPFWQRVDKWSRSSVPVGFTLFLLLLGLLPWHLPELGTIGISLVVISVFYWGLKKPQLMTPWSVLVIGLIGDLLGVTPMGVGTVSLLLLYAIVRSQARALRNMPFLVIWGAFILMAFITILVSWLLTAATDVHFPDIKPAIFLYLFDIVCYPPLSYVFDRLQRSLLPEK
ncbi:MAG TPA: rod shape-determining protein MreD [Dongiaceae bacterium]|nr:rod shape-determining protein MreD [Dongiaceae bacterium]